ncbi:hypothetical protein IHE44_0007582, partial [Lamprotornis superbus]
MALLDLAIGAPEHGTVNLAAMRKLLEAVLVHLDVQYLSTQEPWPGQLSGPSLADVAVEVKEIKKKVEVKHKPEATGGMAEAKKKFQEEQDKVKKLEADVKKLKEDIAKWKEESSKEMSQQLEAPREPRSLGASQTICGHGTVPEQPCGDNPALVPISLARAMQQEMMHELQKMEEQQEMKNTMLEQLLTETANQLNEQLAEIGEIAWTVQAEQERVKAECSRCTFDINVQLGELLQRCEKLQEQVDSLESRQMAMGKPEKIR